MVVPGLAALPTASIRPRWRGSRGVSGDASTAGIPASLDRHLGRLCMLCHQARFLPHMKGV
jgi:hypothetical protein